MLSTSLSLLRSGLSRHCRDSRCNRIVSPGLSMMASVVAEGIQVFDCRPMSTSTSTSNSFSDMPAVTLPERKYKSLWGRMKDKYSLAQHQYRVLQADRLFRFAQIRADDPIWYGPGRVGGEFRPRHAMLTMHLWFLHRRLVMDTTEEHHNSLMIQEELFDLFWDDTQKRIRERGLPELTVNKNLEKVQQYTFHHLCMYDQAFSDALDGQPEARFEQICNIVWTHILLREPDANADQVHRLVYYIEAQHNNIMNQLPENYWRDARLAWVDIPDFDVVPDPKGKADEDPMFRKLPPGWNKALTMSGEPYYWNPAKGISQFEVPTKE